MTFVKSKRSGWIVGTILIMTLVSHMGCAKFASRLRANHPHPHCRRDCTPVEAATVDVGGQVHEPRQIAIGADGLTLRRALLLAGGARELVTSELKAGPPANDNQQLAKLKNLGREIGKYNFYLELYSNLAEGKAKTLSGMSVDDVGQARQEKVDEADALIEALSGTIGQQFLNELVGYSQEVGTANERLRLQDQLQGEQSYQQTADAVESLETNLAGETETYNLLAGSTTEAAVQTYHVENLVALERARSRPTITYYFPYDMATAGQAGEIELQGGDVVQVIDLQNTSLNPLAPSPGGAQHDIVIQGMVASPRTESKIPSIGGVHASTKRTIDDPRGVWMLVRPSASGLTQNVFVLPNQFVSSGGPAANSLTYNGDVYTYTILPQVPIILDSLLVQVLGATQQQEAIRCRIRARHRQRHNAKHHEVFDKLRKPLSAPEVIVPEQSRVLPQ